MARGLPLPRPVWKRFLLSVFTWDLVIALNALPLACIAVEKLRREGTVGWWAYIFPLIATLATGWRCYLNWLKDSAAAQIHALEGALHVLNQCLLDTSASSTAPPPKLRLTIHVPTPDGQHLVQLLDYVGDQRRKKTKGRKTRANCGVIGEALRTKGMSRGSREDPDYERYISELITRWHFTEEDARNLDAASMAWLALPITDGQGKVAGVLFADSVDKGFFTDDRSLVAMTAATGIAEFVKLRLL